MAQCKWHSEKGEACLCPMSDVRAANARLWRCDDITTAGFCEPRGR